MAKLALMNKQARRKKLVAQYAKKRAAIKEKMSASERYVPWKRTNFFFAEISRLDQPAFATLTS